MGLFRRKGKNKFGEILIEKGMATRRDVEEALKIQQETFETKQIQKKIGAILSEKGVIDEADIDNVLAEQRRKDSFILKGLAYTIFHSRQPK